jgi:hypothetical protein
MDSAILFFRLKAIFAIKLEGWEAIRLEGLNAFSLLASYLPSLPASKLCNPPPPVKFLPNEMNILFHRAFEKNQRLLTFYYELIVLPSLIASKLSSQ